MPPLGTPLAHPTFNLNTAGVAGFFGGEEAISAMATVHLYKGRQWLGWYNSPGSYTIAKRFGRMANSRFWDGLFPGANDSPAVSFELDGKKGPQYIAALSGTTLQTGHLGYLTMERSKEVKTEKIKGRETTPINVAYLAMKNVDYNAPVKLIPFKSALWGLIPITVSIVTCIMCALVYDWFSCSMILIGIFTNGLASAFIGVGKLVIKSVSQPASGAPSGHGILIGEDGVVVIKGKERDVNAITKGQFDLLTDPMQSDEAKVDEVKEDDDESDDEGDDENADENENDKKKAVEEKSDEREYRAIGVCSLLLLLQFLLQLLLIMFLFSLGVSWGYNSYLSSLEKEKIQAGILFKALGDPEMCRFRAGTRTTMAVFVCLLLFYGVERSSPEKDRELRVKILKSCVPNDTDVWKRWREKVVDQLLNIDEGSHSLPYLVRTEGDLELPTSDKKLLKQLLKDARAAFRGYLEFRGSLPVDSSHQ
ncbi:hypothetical protein EV363DRAFT_1330193 [Boletus edulis]|nr:hypothetical protein EV363DRAFT_1330193 [Boletus edulis]